MSTKDWLELKAYLEIEGKNSLEILTVETEDGSKKFSIDAVRLLSFVRTEATSRMVGNTLCGKCRTQKRFTTAFACSADGSCAISVCDDCLRSLVSSFQEPNIPNHSPVVGSANWKVGDFIWVTPNEIGRGSGEFEIQKVGRLWVEVGCVGRQFHKTLRTERGHVNSVGAYKDSLGACMLSLEEKSFFEAHLKESLRITSSAIASPHGVLPLTVK